MLILTSICAIVSFYNKSMKWAQFDSGIGLLIFYLYIYCIRIQDCIYIC